MAEDFYELLDVPHDASKADVRRAFREQVRIYHPDHNDDDRAQAQFTVLKKAYDVLADPVERRAYDRLGHKDYVAKRTDGLPSPDRWPSARESDAASERRTTRDTDIGSDGSTDTASGAGTGTSTGTDTSTASASPSETTSTSTSTSSSPSDSTSTSTSTTTKDDRSTGSTDSTSQSSAQSRSQSQSRSRSRTGSASKSGSERAGRTASTTSTTSTSATTSASATRSAATSTAGSTDGGTARASAGAATRTGDSAGGGETVRTSASTRSTAGRTWTPFAPVVDWWRRRSLGWPLLWSTVVVYLAGLVHFGIENDSGLTALVAEAQIVGGDVVALWTMLSTSRHGIDAPIAYLTATELVAPPLSRFEWYVALAGVVALSLAVVLINRIARRSDTWGPVSIDETLTVAVALGVSTVLVGGPLLAGAVLMPAVFGVVVYRTRSLPGWSPATLYLYVLAVCSPVVGLLAWVAGYGSLTTDLLLFVVLPLLGAIGLSLRVAIRRRFGR